MTTESAGYSLFALSTPLRVDSCPDERAWHDRGDLTDAELGDELFENVDVFLQAYDDDGVDVGMLIERLKRVDG